MVKSVEPQVLVLLGVVAKRGLGLLDEHAQPGFVGDGFAQGDDPRAQRAAAHEALDPGALAALDEDLQGVVGQADDLLDHAERADAVELLARGVVHPGFALGEKQHAVVARLRFLEGALGLGAAHVYVLEGAREDHLGPQSDDRQFPFHAHSKPHPLLGYRKMANAQPSARALGTGVRGQARAWPAALATAFVLVR